MFDIPDNTELNLRLATLYANGDRNTCKLKVRVLPEMLNWKEEDLPWYPVFSATSDLHGNAEKDMAEPNVNYATQYWVACTKDYKTGFVITEANTSSDSNSKKALAGQWGFDAFYKHVSRCGLDTSRSNYKELRVLYSNRVQFGNFEAGKSSTPAKAKTSTCLIVTNVRTGDVWVSLGSGTLVHIGQGKIYLRCGSPSAKQSFIRMTPGDIYIKASNSVTVDAPNTSYQKHGGHGVMSFGLAPCAVDGIAFIPIPEQTT